MNCIYQTLVFLLGLLAASGAAEYQDKPATPKEQYQTLLKQFGEAARSYLQSDPDEREKAITRIEQLAPQFLELAERNAKDPISLDALVQAVNLELYLENNSSRPGRSENRVEAKAIAILLRDHVQSERLGEATQRVFYGFSRECEVFLRTVLEKNPHREIQGLTCLRLAQFLNWRSQRLDPLKDEPEMAKRYEGLFGKDYLESLHRQDRAEVGREVEAIFERAAEQYGDVKLPYADTVGVKAKADLHEIRHLSVGKESPDIDGVDQDGKRFRLSDYRGKVVLLYFWSEY
jgi:hypothetical protein